MARRDLAGLSDLVVTVGFMNDQTAQVSEVPEAPSRLAIFVTDRPSSRDVELISDGLDEGIVDELGLVAQTDTAQTLSGTG